MMIITNDDYDDYNGDDNDDSNDNGDYNNDDNDDNDDNDLKPGPWLLSNGDRNMVPIFCWKLK